jgi:hypothetical protein
VEQLTQSIDITAIEASHVLANDSLAHDMSSIGGWLERSGG